MLNIQNNNYDAFKDKKKVFIIIFVYLLFNWISMIISERMACNDFYPYYIACEKLFSGNFKIGVIPPIFPLLIGLLGKAINVFLDIDGYIFAGRLISLFSGYGVALFTFNILDYFSRKYAILGTIFLIVSPFYLKLLSTAQTDLLYLLFVSMFFYYLLLRKKIVSIAFAFVGALTRFEGIVLVPVFLISFFRVKKKRDRILAFFFILLSPLLYTIYSNYFYRISLKINSIISNQDYLYYLQKPKNIVILIYDNFFYFLPTWLPGSIKWLIFYSILFFFILGLIKLFKLNWQLFFGVLFYLIIFIAAKGYIKNINSQIEFRRWLSFLWFFYIFVILGIDYFFSYMIKNKMTTYLKKKFFNKKLKIISIIFFMFFVGIIYRTSYKKTFHYINNDSNFGSYRIAEWINRQDKTDNIIYYSNRDIVNYYLKKKLKRPWILFTKPEIYNNEKILSELFLNKVKKDKIKYILFDGYGYSKDFEYVNAIKRILFKERDKGKYFTVIKHFKYKNKYAGSIVVPIQDKSGG